MFVFVPVFHMTWAFGCLHSTNSLALDLAGGHQHQQQYGWMRTTRITLQTLTLAQPPSPYQTFCTIRSNVGDMKTFTFRSMFFSTFAIVFFANPVHIYGKAKSHLRFQCCTVMSCKNVQNLIWASWCKIARMNWKRWNLKRCKSNPCAHCLTWENTHK